MTKSPEIIEVANKRELYQLFPKNGIGAELGTCQGDNALMLYRNTQPKELYLIDIWERNEATYQHHPPELVYDDWREMVRNKLPHPNVHLVKQDTLSWLDSIPDNFLDWVYIDSLHQYHHVNQEYIRAINKVKKGGIISGHDFYCHPTAWKTGVIRAVLNQVQNNNLIITHISADGPSASTLGINTKS